MVSLVGKILDDGKYTVEQELGRGGFGITYRAINHALNQIVVIKTLDEAWRLDPKFTEFQRQFQDEARRLARCNHPNIVRVSDFFVEDGLPCIVMDYIPGQTLGEIVLPDRPLPEAVALRHIQQVADAVRVIHRNGLLHRDIKPQNLILRQGTDQVVLIDFGIAREFTPGSVQTHTHLVSDGYAPIEQYLPQATRTSAIDVYALAATLYTLLTAQVPISAVLRDRVPMAVPRDIRPDLSAAVSEAVMRGMAIEPQHRPATVDAWLALFPTSYSYPSGMPAAGSVSRMATVPVAPVHRNLAQPMVAPAAVPQVKRSRPSGKRLPILALIGAIASFLLGYVLVRSLNFLAPEQDDSPSPAPVQTSTPAERDRQRRPDPPPAPVDEPEQPAPEAVEPSPSPSPESETPVEAISPSPAVSETPSPAPSTPAPPVETPEASPTPEIREPAPPSPISEPSVEPQPAQPQVNEQPLNLPEPTPPSEPGEQ